MPVGIRQETLLIASYFYTKDEVSKLRPAQNPLSAFSWTICKLPNWGYDARTPNEDFQC